KLKRVGLRAMHAVEFLNRPPKKMITAFFAERSIIGVFGPPKSRGGKTTWTLCEVLPFVARGGRVVWVAGEDQPGVAEILKAWCIQARRMSSAFTITENFNLYIVERAVNPFDDKEIQEFLEEVRPLGP